MKTVFHFALLLLIACPLQALAPSSDTTLLSDMQIKRAAFRFSQLAAEQGSIHELSLAGHNQAKADNSPYFLRINPILKIMKKNPDWTAMEAALTGNGLLRDAHITWEKGRRVVYLELQYGEEQRNRIECLKVDLEKTEDHIEVLSGAQDPFLESLKLPNGEYKMTEGLLLQVLQTEQIQGEGKMIFPVLTLEEEVGRAMETYFNGTATAKQNSLVLKVLQKIWPNMFDAHRGRSAGSQFTTEILEESVREIRDHFNAPDTHLLIFSGNTSEAVDHSLRILESTGNITEGQTFLGSRNAHHSFLLPYLGKNPTVYFMPIDPKSQRIDVVQLAKDLEEFDKKDIVVDWLFAPAADNVPGTVNDIPEILRLAKRHKIKVAVDAAQLTPHYDIDITHGVLGESDEVLSPDLLFFSGHKTSSGTLGGVFIRKDLTNLDNPRSAPPKVGGSTVALVPLVLESGQPYKGRELLESVRWATDAEKFHVGSPNTTGIVQLAAALKLQKSFSYAATRQKKILTLSVFDHFRKLMSDFPGLQINVFGLDCASWDDLERRLAVISFMLTYKGYEITDEMIGGVLNMNGFNVRIGCFCAHPGVLAYRQAPSDLVQEMIRRVDAGDKRISGLTRLSFSPTNLQSEVEHFMQILRNLIPRFEPIDENRFKVGDWEYVYVKGEGFCVPSVVAERNQLIGKKIKEIFDTVVPASVSRKAFESARAAA